LFDDTAKLHARPTKIVQDLTNAKNQKIVEKKIVLRIFFFTLNPFSCLDLWQNP
jgi:hypothetical protein